MHPICLIKQAGRSSCCVILAYSVIWDSSATYYRIVYTTRFGSAIIEQHASCVARTSLLVIIGPRGAVPIGQSIKKNI